MAGVPDYFSRRLKPRATITKTCLRKADLPRGENQPREGGAW